MVSIDKTKNKPLSSPLISAAGLGLTLVVLLASAATAPAHAGEPKALPAFMPVGHEMAAPTAFLELCARSPIDCERSPQANDAEIIKLARQAIVAKYEQAFAHTSEPSPGAVKDRIQAFHPSGAHANSDNATAATAKSNPDYTRVALDNETLSLLKSVNRHVNRSLIADTDAHVYSVNDYWDAPALTPGARGDCEDFALVKRRLLIQQGIPSTALSLAIVRTRYDEDHAVLVVSTLEGDMVLDNLTDGVKAWQKTGYTWLSRQAPGNGLTWVSLFVSGHVEAHDNAVAAIR
jgi:predicted transglutaminase-like cysteine proteinase